ncbi:uncharacterized protein MICPUCDRAFT_42601 [Micromonas pusilla CCMP1545]|uniref:Predicted protein n=1 Tax=Micromonas pusilla (strain CCMP1545) TaxID=564608 RepID=C1N5B5_MICPC|nr:uncharacterized protein MICPUCDRAFT_42601 [Micromonas pusilla CCMP1545]EEH53082.1 predicted protein [Micromonas pusilla CCMP1545]|eukprot:XP_003063143.1 predicted protein [Micromonas pusilla CCMP1545]
MIAHGVVHTLAEVRDRADALHEHSVRVLGRLESYDPATCRGRIEHDGATLAVDASVVPSADAPRIGSLYQYIGELDCAGAGGGPDPTAPRPVLRARVARCVDGLDVRVYFSAHREREKFLNPRKKASAGGGRT